MDHACGLGVCYSEMEVRFALAEHLLAGTTVEARIWQCRRCGCWHFGRPKYPKGCIEWHKRRFRSLAEAEQELELIRRKKASGAVNRLEDRAYQCGKHWHLTSQPERVVDGEDPETA